MKRSPLRRKTPLRGGSTLRKSTLSPVSKKRKAALSIYYRKRLEFLALHPWCEARIDDRLAALALPNPPTSTPVCSRQSEHVHHMARRGPFLLVESTWLAVCPICHTWIETHANVSRQLGLLK
jgi:hypothetical protein